MKAVFLSDAHIRDNDDPNLPPLLSFLHYLQGRAEHLFVVGDLFDTWFGFPRAVFDEYVPLLGALHGLARAGTRITYITGNHDFEMGPFFERILHADIHDTEMSLETDGHRAFVAHGDMANPRDRKYRSLRRILRSAPIRRLGRSLPPSWVWRIAQYLTNRYTGEDVARRMPLREVFSEYAAARQRDGFDTVILGHLHIPVFETRQTDGGSLTYVNLGDWITWHTFLRWDDGRLELKQWGWPKIAETAFHCPEFESETADQDRELETED